MFDIAFLICLFYLAGAHYAVIMFNFGWVAVIETTVITTVLQGFSLPANPFEWYLIVILGKCTIVLAPIIAFNNCFLVTNRNF